MSKNFIPRFRGIAVQKGKEWGWDLFITIGPDTPENEDIVISSKQGFINKEAALFNMKTMIPKILRETCKAMGLPEPSDVLDLKSGTQLPIDEYK